MSAARECIAIEETEGVAIIRLNRPEVLNAFSTRLAEETNAALLEFAADDAVRAIILTGAGDRAFSAGADLNEVASLEADEIEPWLRKITDVYRSILNADKPVIAALNGVAAGAGFQCAMVSDLRVGCTRTAMSQPEIDAGVPNIMGSYLMTLYLPWSINQELSYTGRLLDAEECMRYGLLNDMVSPADLIERSMERVRELTSKARLAFQLTKAQFRGMVIEKFDAAFAAAVDCTCETIRANRYRPSR